MRVSLLTCALLLLAGCGSQPPACTPTSFSLVVGTHLPGLGIPDMLPPTADHKAEAPGNQVHFTAFAGGLAGPHCATPLVIGPILAQWTVSDPVNVQMSSASDGTNGLANCVGATNGKVTVTATATQGKITETATDQLLCK